MIGSTFCAGIVLHVRRKLINGYRILTLKVRIGYFSKLSFGLHIDLKCFTNIKSLKTKFAPKPYSRSEKYQISFVYLNLSLNYHLKTKKDHHFIWSFNDSSRANLARKMKFDIFNSRCIV